MLYSFGNKASQWDLFLTNCKDLLASRFVMFYCMPHLLFARNSTVREKQLSLAGCIILVCMHIYRWSVSCRRMQYICIYIHVLKKIYISFWIGFVSVQGSDNTSTLSWYCSQVLCMFWLPCCQDLSRWWCYQVLCPFWLPCCHDLFRWWCYICRFWCWFLPHINLLSFSLVLVRVYFICVMPHLVVADVLLWQTVDCCLWIFLFFIQNNFVAFCLCLPTPEWRQFLRG